MFFITFVLWKLRVAGKTLDFPLSNFYLSILFLLSGFTLVFPQQAQGVKPVATAGAREAEVRTLSRHGSGATAILIQQPNLKTSFSNFK